MFSLQGVKHQSLVSPRTCATNATITSINIDTSGFSELQICVMRESNAATNAGFSALTIQQSDDTVATNFATVSGLVAGTDYTVTAAIGGANSSVTNVAFVANVDLRGKKRYFRVLLTPATASASVAAHVILARGAQSALDSAAGAAQFVQQPD